MNFSPKIVHLNTAYGLGGAGIAARRLHSAMRDAGLDSSFVAASFYSGASFESNQLFFPEAKSPRRNKLKFLLLSQVENFFRNRSPLREAFSWDNALYGFRVEELPAVRDADVIYLHWINNGFLSIKSIEYILSLGKPTYWVMHDMWALTGGCHYSLDCQKYLKHCSFCPILIKQGARDLSFRNFARKSASWASYTNLHVITPSEWLEQEVRKSAIFARQDVQTIHNTLDWNIFKPCSSDIAREILNLPQDRYLLLFGADAGASNPYKGWRYLKEALNNSGLQNTEVVVFGSEYDSEIAKSLKYKAHFLGRLNDEYSLSIAYSACDLFVTPSLADNWPSTILEAHCCGKPVLAFDVGGIHFMIQHGVDGWLVPTKNTLLLAEGLTKCQANRWDTDRIRRISHELVDAKGILQGHAALWERDLGLNKL